jgi:hypothetical protein
MKHSVLNNGVCYQCGIQDIRHEFLYEDCHAWEMSCPICEAPIGFPCRPLEESNDSDTKIRSVPKSFDFDVMINGISKTHTWRPVTSVTV